MSTGRWALLVASVTVVACGKAEPSGAGAPLPMGAAGSAVSAGAGAGAAGAATGGAASGSGGGQAVAGAATGGAGGGAPSSSGAGGSPASAAGTSGGPSGLGPDPAPVGEPAGVVKTSSNYLVFAQQTTAGTGQRQLMFLDLQGNGEPVQVSAAASKNVVHSIAGDRHAYLYAQVDPFGQSPAPVPRDDDLYLNVFTDSGYVPGALVAGFAGRPALYSPLRFDATSRFAVAARYLPPRGLDFIDAARNTRHYSLDFTVDNFSFAWAPTGYLFEYTLMSTLADQNPANRQTYLAKLIDGGISAPQLLPTGIRDQHFTADARRLTYSLENGTDPISFGYVEPPAAPRQFYASTGDRNVSAPPTFFMEAGDESLLAELAVPGDASHWAISRLFSDGIRPPVVVSDPAPSVDAAISESGSLAALFSTTDDETQRIELLRGTERFTLSETKGAEEFEGFFVGEHLVYFILYPDSTTGGELHSAALQGSTVVDTVVGKSDRWLSNFCQTAVTLPGNRYYYLYTQPAGVRFIDLALGEPAATRSIDATEPTATVDECPVCNAAGDACAYVERTDTHSKIFRVHFDPAGPSEPKLIFESDQSISLVAAHIQ